MFAVKLWKKMRNKRENMILKRKKGYGNQNTLEAKAGKAKKSKMTL